MRADDARSDEVPCDTREKFRRHRTLLCDLLRADNRPVLEHREVKNPKCSVLSRASELHRALQKK